MKGLTVAAVALAVSATAASAQMAADAHGASPAAASTQRSIPATDFAAEMRRLWEDHILWTRQFIVSAVADLPDKDLAAQRLLRNQEDIGNAVKPFYGPGAGDRLTGLLKSHITVAADLVGAAKQGNQDAVKSRSAAWYANADSISTFLASANPNWRAADLKATMREHLDLTLKEATARLQKDWQADIAAYDRIHHHILGMADVLSSGIVKQFPDKFATR